MKLDEFIAKKKAELDDYAENFNHASHEDMLVEEDSDLDVWEFSFSEWEKEI